MIIRITGETTIPDPGGSMSLVIPVPGFIRGQDERTEAWPPERIQPASGSVPTGGTVSARSNSRVAAVAPERDGAGRHRF